METSAHVGNNFHQIVLQNDSCYLVVNPRGNEEQEVKDEDGFYCDCFNARSDQNGHCEHIQAVKDFLDKIENDETMGMNDADRYLSRIGMLDRELNEIVCAGKSQAEAIHAWVEAESKRINSKREFYLNALYAWMQTRGEKTRSLVHGTVKLRNQQPKIEILDEAAVLSDARFRRIIPEKIEVDRKALRHVVMKLGEEPEGIQVELVPPKLSYTTSEVLP